MERTTDLILAALKQALAESGPHRLYRSGKLTGLFPGKTGGNAEAAARAIRDGLLEMTHTETKGKTCIEWVRVTPKGVAFLHAQESPVELLREVRAALQTTRQGVPLWLGDIQVELQKLQGELTQQIQRYLHRLDALQQRVEETLQRAESLTPTVPEGLAALVPWAADALSYLDHRGAASGGACPLPELFAALHEKHAALSLPAFHDGLRQLHQRRSLSLMPADPAQPLPEPEHAVVDGDAVFYYALR